MYIYIYVFSPGKLAARARHNRYMLCLRGCCHFFARRGMAAANARVGTESPGLTISITITTIIN